MALLYPRKQHLHSPVTMKIENPQGTVWTDSLTMKMTCLLNSLKRQDGLKNSGQHLQSEPTAPAPLKDKMHRMKLARMTSIWVHYSSRICGENEFHMFDDMFAHPLAISWSFARFSNYERIMSDLGMRLRWYTNNDLIINILGLELCVQNSKIQAKY